jgi:hypothetical protein
MWRALLCAVLFAGLTGCKVPAVYSLYRAHPTIDGWRIYIATFDAEGEIRIDNDENCARAAALFMKEPGVTVRYWCEVGRGG